MKKILVTVIILVSVFSFNSSISAQNITNELSFYNTKSKSGYTNIPIAEGAVEVMGDTLYTFPIEGNGVNTQLSLGVTIVDGLVVISSAGASSTFTNDNVFYRYTLEGTFIDSIPQPATTSGWGYRDLAFDGTNILASDSEQIKKIDPDSFTIVSSISNGLNNPHRGIAYDDGVIYTTNFRVGPLVKIDALTGTTLRNYGTPSVAPYGIAADTHSHPTKTSLWYAEPTSSGTFRLSKVDTSTGYIVLTYDLSSIFPNSSSGGLEIINNHPNYPDKIIAVMLVQGPIDLIAFVDITSIGVPMPPSNLVASSQPNELNVTLTWNDPVEDVAGNQIIVDSIVVFRNGERVESFYPGVETYTNHFPEGVAQFSAAAYYNNEISSAAYSNNVAVRSMFFDDFNSGLSNWEIINNGICPWENFETTNYNLPMLANGKCLAADSDDCGNGTHVNSIAMLKNPIDLSIYPHPVTLILEFDSDWRKYSNDDFGYVELSSDGINWETALTYNNTDVRNTHVSLDVSPIFWYEPQLKLRFRTVMPGWHWHWAIDNVAFYISFWMPFGPQNLTAALNQNPDLKVELTWDEYNSNETGFKIFRKIITPDESDDLTLIGTAEAGTTSYTDSTVLPLTDYEYRIQAVFGNGLYHSDFSEPAFITIPLPVELTSFTAKDSEEGVLLNWTTATETNNNGFHIERSYDGKEFTAVAFVKGRGTTTELSSYSYVDRTVSTGKYFYRLKQIDFDGSYEYSNTLEVEYDIVKEYGLEQNYPNPFNPTTKINYQLPESGVVELKVYDALGNMVDTLVEEHKEAGKHKVEFFAGNLSSGVYFYRINVNNYSETYKMMLMK